MALDVWTLKGGDLVRLVGGAVAQIVEPTEDGRWIPVHYVEVPEAPGLVGTEDLCSEDEIIGLATPPAQEPKP